MNTTLQILYWVAGWIVLAEALNKLERTAPCAPRLSRHDRLVAALKAVAWALLAAGAGVAVFLPILYRLGVPMNSLREVTNPTPSLVETAVLVGFAILIIRTRVKEG
jgi:hypothetical protein